MIAASIMGVALGDHCSRKYETISAPSICQNSGYSMTGLPNFFNHTSQSEAFQLMTRRIADKEWLGTECRELLTNFVCSLYSPVCLYGYKYPIPPCRRLCWKIIEACRATVYDVREWPEDWECIQYPNKKTGRYESGSQICVDWDHRRRLTFRYFDKW